MLLIKDYRRMKLEATTPYDSTHEQQHRLLPISHPEEWAAASQGLRDSGYLKGPGSAEQRRHRSHWLANQR